MNGTGWRNLPHGAFVGLLTALAIGPLISLAGENPTVPYLTPDEELATFQLPDGYRLELVVSDPDIREPVAIVFDGNGRFETMWTSVHRPSGMCMTFGRCPLCYVGEIGPYLSVNRQYPNLGPRVSILDNKGNVLARLGRTHDGVGQEPGQFMSPHGIAVDSRGDIYVGEVVVSSWPSAFPGKPVPPDLKSLQKLEKLPEQAAAGS